MPYDNFFGLPYDSVSHPHISNPHMWHSVAAPAEISFKVEGRYVPSEVKDFLEVNGILNGAIVNIDSAIKWGLDYWVVELKSGSVAWVRKAPLKIVHPTPASGCCAEKSSVSEAITIPVNIEVAVNGKPLGEETYESSINEMSADNARDTVLTYQEISELHGVDNERLLCSLITDLLHSCDRNGLVFTDAVNEAFVHYHAEVANYGEVKCVNPTVKLDTLQDEIAALDERGREAAALFTTTLQHLDAAQQNVDACQNIIDQAEARVQSEIDEFNYNSELEVQAIFARRGLYFPHVA